MWWRWWWWWSGQVWKVRVDVHTLNNDGNLMDAASIAAIAALCHFRRPDVGVQGEEVTVVSESSCAPPPRGGGGGLVLNPAFFHTTPRFIFICFFISSVQSGGERPHSSEHLPHAHQHQLRLLPAGVRVHTWELSERPFGMTLSCRHATV